MEKVRELYNNLKNLKIQEVEKTVLEKNSAEIIELNKKQLEVGEDSDGLKLPEYRFLWYANEKQSMGSKSGLHYDLKYDGGFYAGFFYRLEGANLILNSSDEKRDRIVNELTSEDIFGLQKKILNDLVQRKLLPDTIQEIKLKLKI